MTKGGVEKNIFAVFQVHCFLNRSLHSRSGFFRHS